MTIEDTPESTFLVTELRYTLGQLHVQLGDLLPDQRTGAYNGTSVNDVLRSLIHAEAPFQQRLAQMLGTEAPATSASAAAEPSDADFEQARLATIAMLERAPTPWPPQLTELVRAQVDDDRQKTTQLAELRTRIFSHPSNPALNEPLTEPH